VEKRKAKLTILIAALAVLAVRLLALLASPPQRPNPLAAIPRWEVDYAAAAWTALSWAIGVGLIALIAMLVLELRSS